ncbi:N-acetylmuramoyl-L-alanine amidase [Paenibacillus chitinolyticus]|uniref:N-acetylmuramoyl-L-alanine amidase family protein n=1 Tax=Paenibacillus chitinolyticus TaxID=79263 RepID=UPI003555E603
MKRSSRKQLQSRRAIWMSIIVLTGMVWSLYKLSASLTLASASIPSAELAVSPGKSYAALQNGTSRYKIVIDPGHGGKDPGAAGVSGKQEKAYTLALSKKVFDQLRQDPAFDVVMTRTDDTFVELGDRAQIANELGADAFISIHGNTYKDPDVSGTETFYYADDSSALAHKVHEQLVKTTGFKDRGVKKEGWQVLRDSKHPAVLLEVGYLTNPDNETDMLNEARQIRTAEAIANGIKKYFTEF